MDTKFRPVICRFIIWVLLLLQMSVFSGCMPMLPKQGIVQGPRTYRVASGIKTGAFKRDYHIYVPAGYDGRQKLPLVVVVHGAFDTAKGIEKISGFNKMADREKFIVLYPNGIGILGFLQHWNAGHCCGKAQADHIDDVGFVAAAIESSIKRLNVDCARVFMLGFSNGGMFTHRFASEKSHILAGAAALAASMGSRIKDGDRGWQIAQPANQIPFFIVHGTADTHVPYNGWIGDQNNNDRIYQSVDNSVAFWRTTNGCNAAQSSRYLAGGAAQLVKWSECRSGKPVWLLTLQDWGHIWPGPYFTAKLNADDPLKDFDGAQIIWDFFNSQAR